MWLLYVSAKGENLNFEWFLAENQQTGFLEFLLKTSFGAKNRKNFRVLSEVFLFGTGFSLEFLVFLQKIGLH